MKLYNAKDNLKKLPDIQEDLEEGSLESSMPRRRFSRLSKSHLNLQTTSIGPSSILQLGEALNRSITSLGNLNIYRLLCSTVFFLKTLYFQYCRRGEQNQFSKDQYQKLQYVALFLSYESNMIASFCLSYVASNYRRTMLLAALSYHIVQCLNILSFCTSFISTITLFTVVISVVQGQQQTSLVQLGKWKRTLSLLIGAEYWSHILLFLSCVYFTLELNHNRIERNNDNVVLVAFICGCLTTVIVLHKSISSLLDQSFWPVLDRFSIWLLFLVSLFHIFNYTSILFQSVVVWEGNLEESWLFLPISTWYDTHDSLRYHSTLQQLGSFILSCLTTFLLEIMKVALLIRWQVCIVMTSYLSRIGEKMTHRPELISQLFYRCIVIALWMGWSMMLSLTLATGDFISLISDYPFSLSWSTLFSIMSLYLSHWVTILIYAVIIFAYLVQPTVSLFCGSKQHKKWSKLKYLFVLFCIFLSNHPISRYFLLGWFPNLFSSHNELLWITTQLIPSCYLLFILYDESKSFIYLSFRTRQHIAPLLL